MQAAFRSCSSLAAQQVRLSHYRANARNTLVLNADYTPLSITSAIRSIGLISENKAHALEMSGQYLRSEVLRLACPSVIVLSHYVKRNEQWASKQRLFNGQKGISMSVDRRSIFRRDNQTCQYCSAHATTIDHVIPKSKGGDASWGNLVACCAPCNLRKGGCFMRDIALHALHARPLTDDSSISPRQAIDC